MNDLRFTLLTDGITDDALVPILTWLLREAGVKAAIQAQWADLRGLPKPPSKLVEKIQIAVDLHPCDLLFVHRDAERTPREERQQEIQMALAEANATLKLPPAICVVPVRMTEAFLLSDEAAIRGAAGNPNGRIVIHLPRKRDIENLPDPKETLFTLVRAASGLHGRRLKRFSTRETARLVARYADTFSPLRGLSSFDALEADIKQLVQEQKWND